MIVRPFGALRAIRYLYPTANHSYKNNDCVSVGPALPQGDGHRIIPISSTCSLHRFLA